MMGFKGYNDLSFHQQIVSVSEQWWDLKVYKVAFFAFTPGALANNDGI